MPPQVEVLEDRLMPSAGLGLRAEYYANDDLTGLTAVRTDSAIDFDWGAGAPDGVGLTSPDGFSVRWTGQVEPAYSEIYTFTLTSDDGARLWVDGRLLIDTWYSPPAAATGTVVLVTGRKVDVVMEYHETAGNAFARLAWSSPSQPAEVVPQARLFPSARGSILREQWDGIAGSTVADLLASPAFPGQPSGAMSLSQLESPANAGDNYGARIRGYLHPPVSGSYELYLAGDEQGELWLSTDKDPANARLVASVSSPTGVRQWDLSPNQKTVVLLVAGQTYYIEARHKEATGHDHLEVGWRQPAADDVQVIPGNFLSPVLPNVRLYVDQSTASELGRAASFTVTRDDDLGRDLVVFYAPGGTAVNGVDYDALPGTVTIPAGQRSAGFAVVPVNDAELEATESVTVTLLSDSGYLLGTPSSRSGAAALYDDDFLPPGSDALTVSGPAGYTFVGPAFGSRTVVDVAGQPFTQANQLVTLTRPPNDFDIRILTQLLAPVSAGDTLLLTFWARNADPARPFAQVRPVYEQASTPFTKSLSGPILTAHGADWQRFDLAFRAVGSYSPTGLRAQFFFSVGYEPQIAEIGGITLTNYGPTVAPGDLPTSGQTYQGRGGAEAAWRAAAAARIDQSRKADLHVDVRDAAGNPVPGAVVQVRLKEHAFGFGSAIAAAGISDTHPVNGPNYRAIIESYFNKVVFENDLKWPSWQSNPAAALNGLDWLDAHGIDDVRGHNLIWPNWQFIPASPGSSYGGIPYRVDPAKPDSQEEYEAHVIVDGRGDADAWLRQRVLDHIADEAGHPQVRGRLSDWDVVNEPFSHHVVQDLLAATYGVDPRSFLTEWFQTARAADPYARLFLNDFPSLTGGAHLDAFYSTIEFLLDAGAPLDGIGFQGHIGANTPGMDALLAGFDRFAAFDKVLQITEFDQESLDEQLQADFLRDFLTLTFSHSSVDAFLMWGFWQGRQNRPAGALWRLDWSIKPNGQQWLDLTQAEWHTDVTGSTFADGLFRVRGFQGEYEVIVLAGGQTFVVTPSLGAGGTTVTVALPNPRVESVFVNDGSPQRSQVTTATVVFDRVVTVGADAFEVRDEAGELVSLEVSAEERDGRTLVTLFFVGGSLPEGTYTLTVRAEQIHDGYGQALDGDGDGTAGGDYALAFFRLFGDGDGDGDVDDDDLAAFLGTLGRSEGDPDYLGFFDADFDGDVDYLDFFHFRQRWLV